MSDAADAPQPSVTRRPHRRRRWVLAIAVVLLVGVAVLVTLLATGKLGRRYTPPERHELVEQEVVPAPAWDLFGKPVSAAEAERMLQTDEGRRTLSEAAGAVRITPELLARGKQAFYEETFGNEVFLTDVLGMLDGPLPPAAFAAAVAELKGGGTTNLRVVLARDATVGGRQFKKGQAIDTGLDVPAGAAGPLGMPIRQVGTRTYAGVSCALCHSSVDGVTFKVVHGMPNGDLNAGLLIALATNSAAFFTHADVPNPSAFNKDPARTVVGADGKPNLVPDPAALEERVDAALLKWPPGGFDSMTDGVANPSQLPSSWSRGNHPYSFSGAFMAGPFRGLSVQTNNVHALNSDATTEADAAPLKFGIDRELFLAAVLPNAPAERLRWDPKSGRRPGDVLMSADPTPGQPGMNQMVALPFYPRATLIEPTSLWNSKPGERVWERVNAMAAWQDTLVPPPAPAASSTDAATLARGRAAFDKAGCASCHAGPFLTNNKIVTATEVRTQPIRAKAMMNNGFAWEWRAVGYAFDQAVPLPPNARTVEFPTSQFDRGQVALAYGWGDSPGGYKVPSLQGLFWTAPYLHDGGVAVGPGAAVGSNAAAPLGIPGTLKSRVTPDPANSLRAMVDRTLRAKVIEANHADAELASVGVEGVGHEYWVDAETGFGPDDQAALVAWLLAYRPPAQ
jgi:hypothetical protein